MGHLRGGTWAETGDFGVFNLVGRWLRHDSGATERAAWQLTRWGGGFIVRAIPEDHVFRGISLNWEIPDEGTIDLRLLPAQGFEVDLRPVRVRMMPPLLPRLT